jgi:hypothetical protein
MKLPSPPAIGKDERKQRIQKLCAQMELALPPH